MSSRSLPVKVVLLGQSTVGKTCIATRYVRGCFIQSSISTVGASYLTKSIEVNDDTYDFNIWDTAGQELYRSLTPMYYRNAHAALVVFDITNKASYFEAEKWIRELMQSNEDVFIIIVGNKADLEDRRQVDEKDGNSMAEKYKCVYIETSALTGIGIDRVFQMIVNRINHDPKLRLRLWPPKTPPPVVETESRKCC